jgi:hypothetical protein
MRRVVTALLLFVAMCNSALAFDPGFPIDLVDPTVEVQHVLDLKYKGAFVGMSESEFKSRFPDELPSGKLGEKKVYSFDGVRVRFRDSKLDMLEFTKDMPALSDSELKAKRDTMLRHFGTDPFELLPMKVTWGYPRIERVVTYEMNYVNTPAGLISEVKLTVQGK